jgi:hypothetical protein
LDGDLRLWCTLAQSELPISEVDVQKTQKAKQDQNCISKLKPFFNTDSEIRNVIRRPPEQAESRAKMKAPFEGYIAFGFQYHLQNFGGSRNYALSNKHLKRSLQNVGF